MLLKLRKSYKEYERRIEKKGPDQMVGAFLFKLLFAYSPPHPAAGASLNGVAPLLNLGFYEPLSMRANRFLSRRNGFSR